MKKFSLFVTLCLIVGLLAGCAGTPVIYYSDCTCPPSAHEETPVATQPEAPAETEAPVLTAGALKNGLVILQYYFYSGSSLHRLRLVADVGDGNVCTLICLHNEVTVEISHRGGLCTLNANRCADNVFACSIFHMAFHLDLGKGANR